jgi:lactate dehydrogenase-like 2-hydroxyacid dehydrogenase
MEPTMNTHKILLLTQRGQRHQQDALESAPPDLDVTVRRNPPREEVLTLLPDMEVLISERAGDIDASMIAAGRRLKLIQRWGSQTWDIDVQAARQAGVQVCYWPVRSCVLVAEHMILQMLGLARNVRDLMRVAEEGQEWGRPPRRCDEDYFAYNWSDRRAITGLWRSTVGIYGFGEIGLELARRLRAFECTLLYTKRRRLPPQVEAEFGLTHVMPQEMAGQSDIVCSLLPYFPDTDMSIGEAFFAAMKPGAHFVHCGAGAVVDEGALLAALRSGRLGGAALDTFTYEPLRPDDPLLAVARDRSQNLILTPHVGSGASVVQRNARADDYTNLQALFAGEPLRYRLA